MRDSDDSVLETGGGMVLTMGFTPNESLVLKCRCMNITDGVFVAIRGHDTIDEKRRHDIDIL